MDDVITHYKERVADLTRELSEARSEAAKYRVDRSGKIKAAEARVAELEADNAKLAKKVESLPGEVQAENDRLRGEIRHRDHRARFDVAAQEAGMRPDALDAAWKLSGYVADKDAIDDAVIRDTIAKTIVANPFLKVESKESKEAQKPGPGGGQGGREANPAGSFSMSRAQASDPIFQRDNREQIQGAAKAGLLRVTD